MTDQVKQTLSEIHSNNYANAAAQIRKHMEAALQEVVGIMDQANAEGFQVAINLGRDNFGRNRINQIDILRPY